MSVDAKTVKRIGSLARIRIEEHEVAGTQARRDRGDRRAHRGQVAHLLPRVDGRFVAGVREMRLLSP